MAIRAYILIETQVGKTAEVIKATRQIEGVILADCVTGPYDAIATIERENLNVIGELVTVTLHQVSGVSRIVACIAVEIP